MDNDLQEQLEICPSCGELGPPSKFCLSCGASKLIEEDNLESDSVEDQSDTAKSKPIKIQSPILGLDSSIKNFELDSQMKENVVDFINNVNLTLWLIDFFVKDEVDEEDFIELFDRYEYRFEQNLKRRKKMIEVARDFRPMKKAYSEARLRLSELEFKQSIGDISVEEYNLKVPAYQWDIKKYESEMAKNRSYIIRLENFSRLFSDKDSVEIQEKTVDARKLVEEQIKRKKMSKEAGERIIDRLDSILSDFKSKGKK
jgi:hypothetical protein